MTNQEILDQIAKMEKGLSNPSLPESAKNVFKGKIANLKAELEKTEAKVEKKEEKLQSEEKKIQSDLEQQIAKLEKGLNNPSLPASAKEAIKKKIAAAKEEVAKQKAEIKEDVKESAKETKEIKAAVKKLAEVAKKAGKVKTTKKSAAAKPKVESKEGEREKKSEKRQTKLKGMMADLEALIHKNKYLASKYEGKNVDLDRDAKRPAKPFGYRFVGKGDYRVPTAAQIKEGKKTGKIDYEGRPNRADKGPKKEYKFRDGGSVDSQNAEMVLSKAKELKHHADELENLVTTSSQVDAWEVAKMERAATDASDVTHYEDGKSGESDKYDGYMAKGGKTEQGYDDKEDERLSMEHGKIARKHLKSTHARRDDARFEERGKMAKGGSVKRTYRLGDRWRDDFDYEGMLKQGLKSKASWGVVKLKKLHKSFEDVNYHSAGSPLWDAIKSLENSNNEEAEKHIEEFHKNVKAEMDDIDFTMKKGGKLSSKAKYIPKRDIDSFEIEKNGKEIEIDGAKLMDGIYVKKGTKMAKGGKVSYMMGDEEVYIKDSSIGLDDEVCLHYKKDNTILKCISKNQLEKFVKEGKLKKMAYGGMTPGRYYKDSKGEELRFIGESDGKLLFKDGETVVTKNESDFDEPKEMKSFKWFKEGGAITKVERKAKEGAKKVVKAVSGAGKVSVSEIAKLAKTIRKDGEKWTDAIKRAAAQLK
jgi:hypothetical protein